MQVTGLDHVQVSMPDGGEDQARAFYGGLLGLAEVAKPAALADRGGCWFAGPGIALHLGVERPFSPAAKAHVAIGVTDLEAARAELLAAGVAVTDDGLEVGFARFHALDPFGNRIEIVRRQTAPDEPAAGWAREGLEISRDLNRLDLDWLVAALSERAYWAQRRPRAMIVRSLHNSRCYGVYADGRQVGFARVVTDAATFAWLCDVFIDEAWRGRGVGAWLIETIVAEPDLAALRRFILATRDASELYRRHGGFGPLPNPERWMARITD
ncbi:MAG TPA: GNAT family N-acetyltransferase [Candidatus Limnocylindrales bacterium]|nr:GNAT family N-acetyltransferase [Candidatus Limnocylindrales bacterium]